MKILLISLFCFLYFFSFGYAQTNLELRMIQDFRDAVVSKNQDKIHTTWMKLWVRDDVVAYMKKNMPDEFLLYKSHRLVMRVDNIQRKYSGGSSRFSRSEFTSSAYTSPSKSSVGGGSSSYSNRTTVKRNPNQSRESNNITARRSLNQDRPSNQRLMRNSINNSRRTRRFSNSRRYQRRQRPNRVR
ncbi:hypothetical protein MNBD_UNCLBAC01-1053 [hydrothermal vent metagenome]|uniref:Uncharacterized protein n=1 Tax=hydrothermal vent metagenome TaxID=652676 RepID=A0A3B1D5C1_9ZZZZ